MSQSHFTKSTGLNWLFTGGGFHTSSVEFSPGHQDRYARCPTLYSCTQVPRSRTTSCRCSHPHKTPQVAPSLIFPLMKVAVVEALGPLHKLINCVTLPATVLACSNWLGRRDPWQIRARRRDSRCHRLIICCRQRFLSYCHQKQTTATMKDAMVENFSCNTLKSRKNAQHHLRKQEGTKTFKHLSSAGTGTHNHFCLAPLQTKRAHVN